MDPSAASAHTDSQAASPQARTIPLFARFPGLREDVPWLSLTRYPSPTRRLFSAGRKLGHPHLWMKCDNTLGTQYGGNKIRKLEFILAEARQRGDEEIIVVGGIGSHHVLASAVHAKQMGLKVHAVLFPQPPSPHVEEVLRAVVSLGVECHLCTNRAWMIPKVLLEYVRRYLVRVSKAPYVVYPGGSSALGSLGYVNAALELRAQVDAGDVPQPGVIVVPLGSGGTMAGLLVGLQLADLSSQVVGVRVVERTVCNRFVVASLANRIVDYLLRLDPNLPLHPVKPAEVLVEGDYLGRGYGWPTEQAEEAIRFARTQEKVVLEATYSGKAFAAAMAYSRVHKGIPILFWNTYNSRPMRSLIHCSVDDLPPRFKALLARSHPT
ncbi:MAG: pyridoxal-phosphate dependent enzyme [Nitrospirae bacterium]|nr:pyridoxal-phosphate dependent enzyme [Nitrospirota bacterium]